VSTNLMRLIHVSRKIYTNIYVNIVLGVVRVVLEK